MHIPLAQNGMPWGQALLEVLEGLASFLEMAANLAAARA